MAVLTWRSDFLKRIETHKKQGNCIFYPNSWLRVLFFSTKKSGNKLKTSNEICLNIKTKILMIMVLLLRRGVRDYTLKIQNYNTTTGWTSNIELSECWLKGLERWLNGDWMTFYSPFSYLQLSIAQFNRVNWKENAAKYSSPLQSIFPGKKYIYFQSAIWEYQLNLLKDRNMFKKL